MYKNAQVIAEIFHDGTGNVGVTMTTVTECYPGEHVFVTVVGPTAHMIFTMLDGATTFSGALVTELGPSDSRLPNPKFAACMAYYFPL